MSDWAKLAFPNPYHGEAASCASDSEAQAAAARPDLARQVAERYEELRDKVYFYLLASGLSAPDADEFTQETFVRLYLHMRGGARTENVRAWLYRVARNLITDASRSRRWEASASVHEWDLWETTVADLSPDPEKELLANERAAQVQRAMRGLTALQVECLHLRSEGLRYREIAELYGVTIAAVTDVVRRAIDRIGKELE
jgi:RNA polymerase sigma-70 factor (ECF subfamily)